MKLQRLNLPAWAGLVFLWGTFLLAVSASAQTSNGILREVFTGLTGGSIPDLTNNVNYPINPAIESIEPLFEGPSAGDFYGTRMRALLTAPMTGDYKFWIATDDQGQLYLSTDENPATKRLICAEPQWAGSRDWDGSIDRRTNATWIFPSMNPNLPANRSDYAYGTITLAAGQRYYVEALQVEGGGGDNIAVGWQLPDATFERPIPASRMVPFGLGPPIVSKQPTNYTTTESGSAVFSVRLQRMIGSVFQWKRNGTNIPAATNAILNLPVVGLGENGHSFLCAITNSLGGTNSTIAFLSVVADTTRPTISTVGNIGELQVIFVTFSEPIEEASGTNRFNYSIDGGISVMRAAFGPDNRTVVLTTSELVPGVTYTLTVNNVRDRATAPNSILPNSQRTFAVVVKPIDISYLSLPREPLGPTTRRHGVVISEVMYHPTNRLDGRNLEFIELYNSQAWYEEIGGWRISGAIDFTFPSNAVIQARSFCIVAARPADFRATYNFTNASGTLSSNLVFGPFLGSNGLQNGSGTLRLRNRRDAIVFEMNYNGSPPFPAAPDGGGHSLVLARGSYGERDPRAWAASDATGGTPGAADVIGGNTYRNIVFNEVLAHTDPPQLDYIELYNFGATTANLNNMIITDDPTTNKFVLTAGVVPSTLLAGRSFMVLTEAQLGFRLDASGETIFLKHPSGLRVIDSLHFDAQENGVPFGRYPDGAATWTRLSAPTAGTNNAPFKPVAVVINEIMFDPVSGDDNDEFIELHNRSAGTVNVGGWRLRDAVSYNIPVDTFIAPGGYLVIAKNAARLRARYPGLGALNCLGDFSGSLSKGGERIELNFPDTLVSTNALGQPKTNTIHIAVDEVRYGSDGRWGKWAAGGGSSLELRDARADRRLAPNWADSDESAKSQWVTVQATGVMDNGWADAYQLHVTLIGPGEALIDNVEVIPSGGTNLIGNGTFESGADGWVFQGNHNETSWEPSEGYSSSRSLHLRALGRGDTGANRVRTQLPYTLAPGTTVTLRARVRWLKGNPNILLRLRGNWLEAPGYMLTANNLGTPGAPNSRAGNAGPSITDVRHDPPLPAANQQVLVIATVNDPDGVAYLALNYRLDPTTAYTALAMTNNGSGLFSAVLPGQAAGATAAFFIQALDNYPTPAASAFPSDAPARECVVRWGDTTIPGTLGTYRLWLTQTNVSRWINEEKMSNKPKDVTFVYGTNRVIYNAGAWFHGSPYHSPGYDSPVGANCDYDMVFLRDDPLLGETDINLFLPGNGCCDATGQTEIHAYWFGGQFGLPFLYCRPVFMFVNGVRRSTVYNDMQQPNGDFVDQWFPADNKGELHKVQLGFEFGDLAYGASEPGYNVVGADLNRYTTTGGQFKQARYRATWPQRSATPNEQNDYTNIFALVNNVLTSAPVGSDAYTTILSATTDVEEWLKVDVTQHLYNNFDSFSYGGGQNAFAYKPDSDPWKLLLWDVDFAFGGAANDSNLTGIGGAEHGPRNDHPPFARIYWQALLEAANGMLTVGRSNPILDARYSGLTAGGAAVSSPQAIKDFIAGRRAFILQRAAALQAPFAITSNGGADFTTNRNLITLSGTAPLEARTLLINGAAYPATWTSISNWTIRIPLLAGTNVLVFSGVDASGATVAGVSRTLRVQYTGVDEQPQDKIVFNEIMYAPLFANAGYVELYNTSSSNAFDMSGWRLNGVGLTFSAGTVIEPGQFLVVAQDRTAFADTYGPAIPVAAEYPGNLDRGGETLTLIKPGATPDLDRIIDQVTYDDDAPWPREAAVAGSSLQLIDAVQDNNRVANWSAVNTNTPPPPPQWQRVVVTGAASSSTMYIYLQSAGNVYLDDIKLVAGSAADGGANVLTNGDFETGSLGPWVIGTDGNNAASVVTSAIKHSGSYSLHLIASAAGTTRASSINRDIVPALTLSATYTLSFWYLQTPDGGPLVVRLSGNGINATTTIAPPGTTNLGRYTPGAPNSVRAMMPAFPTVWLNEVLGTNFFLGTNGIVDRFGERDPWVELYNGGTGAVSLAGVYLANNYSNLTQWAFPASASLGSKQFLVVWLDGQSNQSTNTEFHANFRAAPDIGSVVLSRGTNVAGIIDHLNYIVPVPGRSFGSYPDGAVSGRRSFSVVTPGGTNNATSPPADIRINEWMADNLSTLADPADGRFQDWIELYNPATNFVDLTGWFLSDTLTNATGWLIPSGTTMAPGGYLLVWADNEPAQNTPGAPALHAGFSLAKSGEAIGLFSPDGMLVDGVVFGAQTSDVSQGRFPDGDVNIVSMTNATPGSANYLLSANTAPVLAQLPDRVVDEGTPLTFTATATDTNVPAQTLTFSLDPGAPTNASIGAMSGVFLWIPTEAQGPGNYSVTIRVTDNGVPPASDTKTLPVTVTEVNEIPTLSFPMSQEAHAEAALSFTAIAMDADLPVQLLSFSLDAGAPGGTAIDASTGRFTWTPTVAQLGMNAMSVRVTDSGVPAASIAHPLSVRVFPALRATVTQVGNQVTIHFPTIPGRHYRVEFKNELDSAVWTPIDAGTLATGTSLDITDNFGGNPHRFYRVVQVN